VIHAATLPRKEKDRMPSQPLDRVVARARLQGREGLFDIGIASGRIAAVERRLVTDAPHLDAAGMLVVPGLVETHLHLDKCRIMGRCAIHHGTLAEAVAQTARAKAGFTPEDITARATATLRRAIGHGTQHVRTHVELDPGIGLIGLDAVEAVARAHAHLVDVETCVFPQEGIHNRPGTEALLRAALARGVRVIGAAPYCDSDPRAHIATIFRLAREFDAEIDMHLDLAEGTRAMNIGEVIHQTRRYKRGGRVTVGHMTQLSYLPPARHAALAKRLADAGIAVTILPATDLFLMGRGITHAVPRGVASAETLRAAGVTCSVATNNVLNPFTPYGDASLVRMANLYANVCQVATPEALAACLGMVTHEAARLMNLPGYGIAPGNQADLVALDATHAAEAIAALAEPRWGIKGGRESFHRPAATLHLA
jgi:cytosine/creatinine deaminase